MHEFPLTIQTYTSETDTWSSTTFETKAEFVVYIKRQYKLPGKYALKNTKFWNQQARKHAAVGYYTEYVEDSYQSNKYWDNEKDKVLNGIEIDGFYIPGFYYFYLNFLKIYNKKKRKLEFPTIWDSDYHFFLYIMLCILQGKHAAVVKTRQRGYSYKIGAILIWSYWWFEGSINTIGASDKTYVNKTWVYLDTYRDWLNSKTVWRRGPQVPKGLDWLERTLTTSGTYEGHKSTLKGITLADDPTKGVGGAQSFFFYEEAGIAPTMSTTLEYIKPAIKAGDEVTGTIIISGSVGELEDCKDLQEIAKDPEAHGFLGVENIFDPDSEYRTICFFVPETWSFEGYIDQEGNSMIEEATGYILAEREKAKKGKRNDKYQLLVSQSPLTLEEAFAIRKNSYFPQALIIRQQDSIKILKPRISEIVLYESAGGEIKWRLRTEDEPAAFRRYPLPDSITDKRGCAEMVEPPDPKAPFLTYFAAVDPVETDITTTSESLFSVRIFKNLTETTYTDEATGETRKKVTGYKEVAWYTGRYDDLKQTNQIGEYLIRMYNAFTVVESNVQTFINHMQGKMMHRYLATKEEIGFLEDLKANQQVHKKYGVHMTPQIKNYILQNIKEYLIEELDHVRKEGGEVVKTIYGVERIQDMALLDELKAYREGVNVDRVVTFGLVLSLAKHFMINGIFGRKDERSKDKVQEFVKPERSFFRTMDGNLNPIGHNKSYFKHMQ